MSLSNPDSAAQPLPTEPSSSSPEAGAAPAVPKKDRSLGKPLTAKQQAVWDLKQKGKTYKEIAAELSLSWPVVGKYLRAVYKKLGMSNGAPGKSLATGQEYKNPEKFAAVMDAVTDPLNRLADALRAAGVPPGAAEAILKRIRVKFYGAMTEVRNLKKMELDEMLGKKIHLMLSYIDDKVAAEASARDLSIGVAQLIEKQQLIRGEPTQIVSDHERKKLHELLPLAIKEAQRRGLTLEGTVTEKIVERA
jgi:hypothetical protein